MSKGNRLRAKRAAEQASVSPGLTMAVFSTINTGPRLYDADADLAKAAVLYADRVDLYSAVATLHGTVLNELDKMNSGDWVQLAVSAGMLDGEAASEAAQAMATLDVIAANPETFPDQQQEVARLLGDLAQFAESAKSAMLKQITDWGGDPLLEASQAGCLTFRPFDLDPILKTNFENGVRLLRRMIRDAIHPRHGLVLPVFTGEVTQLLNAAGTPIVEHEAKHGATAQDLFARLPAFPRATMAEVLDIRGTLTLPLTQYRAAVSRLSAETASGVGTVDFARHLHTIWTENVNPALAQITEEIQGDKYLTQLATTSQLPTVLASTAALGLVALINWNLPDMIDAVSQMATIAAPAGLGIKTAQQVHSRKQDRKRNPPDFYYLHQVQHRLGR